MLWADYASTACDAKISNMEDFGDLEYAVLTTAPRDISEIESLAEGYYEVARTLDDNEASAIMLEQVNVHVESNLGGKVLFFCGFYAVNAGSVLYEVNVFGVIKEVVPTVFLEAPMDIEHPNKYWHSNGLGLVIEPNDQVFEEIDMPLHDLQGWGSMCGSLTMPINQNHIRVANPMIGPPSFR